MTAESAPVTGAEAAAAAAAEFYDSTRPWLIPAGAARAALYFDGLYGPAGRSAESLFGQVRWITITGDAFNCGIADYEAGNPVFEEPGMLRGFAGWRIERNMRARTYVNRASAARAIAELGPVWRDPRCLFWIATLDNKPWTAGQLAADLENNWGAPIPASQIWAVQNVPAGSWDRSTLFGDW